MLDAKRIKTVDEIECLKAANSMTEAAMDAALRALKPGIRECEVLAIAWQTMTALGSEWTQCANIVSSGPYTAPYRRYTSDRIIRMGDLVIIDIGACFAGYYGDFTRTVVCGDIMPTRRQRELFQGTYFAPFNACGQCRPGKTTADVYRAAQPYVLTHMLRPGAGTNPGRGKPRRTSIPPPIRRRRSRPGARRRLPGGPSHPKRECEMRRPRSLWN